MKLASRENKITTDLLQKDYEFNRYNYFSTLNRFNEYIKFD